ncbi:uncharacterized protein LOC134434912 [Engraulis encrasicolus]|uniref:uncharacterized protein LOC134434912 n=1 Tax=Engraulis encrasicolus TaxID=184585 RepID=UPI002FD3BC81
MAAPSMEPATSGFLPTFFDIVNERNENMDIFERINEPVLAPAVGKKRKASKNNHTRENIKKMRHSGGGKLPAVSCTHNKTTTVFCHADKLTPGDLEKNFQNFYSHSTKTEQDQALLRLITVKKVHRRRPKVENTDKQKEREVTNEYHLLTEDHPTKIPVCKSTFCSVLGISKDRVARVAKYYAVNATARPENRGGARKVVENEVKKQMVKDHIQTFMCRASQQGKKAAAGRKYTYLPSDLSVKKMHRLFDEQNPKLVSYSLYHSISKNDFNLRFDRPSTDACSSCGKKSSESASKGPQLT